MENTELKTDGVEQNDALRMENETTEAVAEPADTEWAEPVSETDPEPGTDSDKEHTDIEKLIAEAEQRGYLRALNERAHAEMSKPVLLENLNRREGAGQAAETPAGLASGFLSTLTPGVWD